MAMKTKKLLLTLLTLFSLVQAKADVEITETYFSDENFRAYLLGQSYGSDGVITSTEIAAIEDLDVSNKQISNLKGIEHFTALTGLYCVKNQLTSLDVSKNTALTRLSCFNNQLTTLRSYQDNS